MRQCSFSLNKGFTIIEVLTTVVIISGLFFILMPLGQSFFSKNLLEKRVNSISKAIKFARNKAVLDGKNIVLSGINDKDGWLSGMQMFIDNTGNYHFEPGDEMIRKWQWEQRIIKVSWHGFSSDNYLLFSNKLKKSVLNGYFSLSQNNKVKSKIILNRLGRLRIEN